MAKRKGNRRTTFTLPEEMAKIIDHYSERWGVTKQEVMRRLFGVGAYIAKGVENGRTYQAKAEASEAAKEIEFAGILE